MHEFTQYYQALLNHEPSEITEHSLRPALNKLLVALAQEVNPDIKIVHEPKREGKFGAPDFKIFEVYNIIGYVENKKIDEQLDKTLKTEQIKKYTELSDNLLLTNYIEWIWLRKGAVQQREILCHIADLRNKKPTLDLTRAKAVKALITNFLSTAPQGIVEANRLAESLALRAKLLKNFIFEELERQEKLDEQPKLKGLYYTFKEFVFNDLTTTAFADAFAQTLIYGLFLAKLNADTTQVNLYNVSQFIPTPFQLIRELVDFLKELENPDYRETRWVVEEVLTILNTLNLRAIQESLSFIQPTNYPTSALSENDDFIPSKDPYIYFYEDFLAAYDKALRKAKGVYYTPSPVVSFIVKSTNEVLKQEFGISDGLSDQNQVTILDFATGTGTFLVEIFQQILETLPPESGKKSLLIKEHLLKNIYGFEYLIAPYAIAHLKLSQFLKEHGYHLADKERLRVFLTNTLEPIDKQMRIPLLPALTKESREAQEIKDKPILVITGNPPYSIKSTNKSKFILQLLKYYKEGLNEKNETLNDDYIKFIRFAHDKINKAGKGILAIITNNSYLEGLSHRRMRETLYNDFDKIYILNLHGNSLRGETDKNIFDIRIGVCILIAVKLPKPLREKQVFYFSTQKHQLVKRKEKYHFLRSNDIKTTPFVQLKPQSPDFWFVEKDLSLAELYGDFWHIPDIFQLYNSGIQTSKDAVVTDRDFDTLFERVREILQYDRENLKELRQKYNLVDTSGWKLEKFLKTKLSKEFITQFQHKPFDNKWLYYEPNALTRDRYVVMQHFLKKENLGLVLMRTPIPANNTQFLVTNKMIDGNYFGFRSYLIPLYTFHERETLKKRLESKGTTYKKAYLKAKKELDQATETYLKAQEDAETTKPLLEELRTIVEEKRTILDNLKTLTLFAEIEKQNTEIVKIPNFTAQFMYFIKEKYTNQYTPEQILSYIYAILYSPIYRTKYADFLKTDFPRIPFIDDETSFIQLAQIGKELIDLHTFTNIPTSTYGIFQGKGDNTVAQINYLNGNLFINPTQYFENVPQEAYLFTIGNYPILERYLKDRQDQPLTLDEIQHLEKLIKILFFTTEIMKKLEKITQKLL